jgi:hypothetical protein
LLGLGRFSRVACGARVNQEEAFPMKARLKLITLCALLPIAAFLWIDSNAQRSSSQSYSATGAASPSVRLAERAIAGVRKKQDWEDVAVDDDLTNDRHYAVILNYKTRPEDIGQVESDTKTIAHAVLDGLMRSGQDPFGEKIDVAVWARRPIDGDSDRQLFEVYGVTNYDIATDQLKFVAERR